MLNGRLASGTISALWAQLALALALVLAMPAQAKEIVVGPFYNPDTKSYFAYVDTANPYGYPWEEAQQLAHSRTFKGIRGRLAVVKDQDTHKFMLEKFSEPLNKPAFIGLRYFCGSRKMMWSDGTITNESPPGVWHPRWHRTKIRCGFANIEYMPVYYMNFGPGLAWQASGKAKHFIAYIVEFATGRP